MTTAPLTTAAPTRASVSRFMTPLLLGSALNPINSSIIATALISIGRDFSVLSSLASSQKEEPEFAALLTGNRSIGRPAAHAPHTPRSFAQTIVDQAQLNPPGPRRAAPSRCYSLSVASMIPLPENTRCTSTPRASASSNTACSREGPSTLGISTR
jgi:hypothetical protein